MHRTSLVSAFCFALVLGQKYKKGRGMSSSEIGCKDTKNFWNMQILKHKKLSFLTKKARGLAYVEKNE